MTVPTSSSTLCNGGVGRINPGSNGVSTEESVVAVAKINEHCSDVLPSYCIIVFQQFGSQFDGL